MRSEVANIRGHFSRTKSLATRTSATDQAQKHHTQALAIARDISAAPEEARALEGLGRCHLQDGNPGQAAEYLRQALVTYQRIGAPAAQRVQQTLHQHWLTPTTELAAPSSEDNQPLALSHLNKPSRDKSPAGSAAEQPDLREQPSAGTKQRKRAIRADLARPPQTADHALRSVGQAQALADDRSLGRHGLPLARGTSTRLDPCVL
jgi:hypothetical protein